MNEFDNENRDILQNEAENARSSAGEDNTKAAAEAPAAAENEFSNAQDTPTSENNAAADTAEPQNTAAQPNNAYTPPQYGNNNAQSAHNTRSFTAPQYNPYAQNNYAQNNAYYQPYQNPVPPKPNPFAQPPKAKSGKRGLKVFCAVLAVVVLLSAGVGIGYIAGGNRDLRYDNSRNGDLSSDSSGSVVIQQGTVPQKDGIEPDADGKYTADEVAELVSCSVVNITVYNDSSSSSAIASGVIIDENGYIISNDHIYSEIPNAKFVITMHDGTSYNAVYVAGDARSDLCVLKMSGAKDLTPAVFADSSAVKSGDDVIAIGSPYGLSGTVTKGIVSCPSRRISFSSTINGAAVKYSKRVIQTDTPINSGNSGGALVNMYGQVVGISSVKIVLSGYEGLCFAIPSNDAVKIANSLITNKKVVGRAKLGITYSEINSASSLVNDIPSGLMIQTVDIDSNLYSSNISQGDIITEINGTKITSADTALDIIDDSSAGDKLNLKIYAASTKNYKDVTATLLEDESASSYTTEEQQPTTSIFNFR